MAESYEKVLYKIDWAKRNIPIFNDIYNKFLMIQKLIAIQIGEIIKSLNKPISKQSSKGIQPSHTKVNKDDPSRNRYLLAKELATYVSKMITPKMLAVWQHPDDPEAKAELFNLIDEFTKHPDSTDWWHHIIDKSGSIAKPAEPVLKEEKPSKNVLATKIPMVWLVSNPIKYKDTIIIKLKRGTQLELIDKGEGESFNKTADTYRWWKVRVVDGSETGISGWIMQTLVT